MGKNNKKTIWLSSGLALLFSASLALPVFAGNASLSIFPQTGTFTVENTFEVSVFLNTGGNDVNAIKIDLRFDPEKLRVVTSAEGISSVEEWIFPPSFSNQKGIITLQGGFLGKGINTSEGLITVIVFRAISSGETTVEFLDSSQILLAESGDNVLSSVNRGVYNIIPSPPIGPRLFSETHPDQNKWYRNPNPTFSWDKIEKVEGYSYELNDDPYGEPNNTIDSESAPISFEEIREGIQYLHLKAKKEGVWGGTSHFKIMIDKTPPEEFKPHLEILSLNSGYVTVCFHPIDSLSGIDHYRIKIADYTDPENIIWTSWMHADSQFELNTKKRGVFEVFIRAFDKAGNFREEEIQVRIFSPNLVVISGGVQIRGLFLPWWLIGLFLGIIFLGAGYVIFKIIKKKSALLMVNLEKEIKEAEKEIEDVRKAKEKLTRIRLLEERGRKEWERLKGKLGKIIKSTEDKKDE